MTPSTKKHVPPDAEHYQLAKRIVWARERVYAKASDAARALGIKPNTWGAYERGQRRPRDQDYMMIAAGLGVNLAWLRDGEGEPGATEQAASARTLVKAVSVPAYNVQNAESRRALLEGRKAFKTIPIDFSMPPFADRKRAAIIAITMDSGAMAPQFSAGDWLFIDRSSRAREGMLAIAVRGLVMVRLVAEREQDFEVTAYSGPSPIFVDKQELSILGRVIGVLASVA